MCCTCTLPHCSQTLGVAPVDDRHAGQAASGGGAYSGGGYGGGGDGYEDDEEGVIEEVIPDMDDE